MTAAQQLAIDEKYGPVVATVGSDSEPGKIFYEVRHNAATHSWSCQCLGYRFSRYCKHVAATQHDMGAPVTLTAGKKPIAMPKIKTPATVPLSRQVAPQAPSRDTEVVGTARALAHTFGVHSRWTPAYQQQAKEMIEQAIRKFMTAVTPVPDVVPAAPAAERGVRMIILED